MTYLPQLLRVFPIKWCHQRVVTRIQQLWHDLLSKEEFPIKWCHQRVVTARV